MTGEKRVPGWLKEALEGVDYPEEEGNVYLSEVDDDLNEETNTLEDGWPDDDEGCPTGLRGYLHLSADDLIAQVPGAELSKYIHDRGSHTFDFNSDGRHVCHQLAEDFRSPNNAQVPGAELSKYIHDRGAIL